MNKSNYDLEIMRRGVKLSTNDLFHLHYSETKALTARRVTLEKQAQQLKRKLADIRTELKVVRTEEKAISDALAIRPFFSRQFDDDVKLSIVGGVGHWGSDKVACVCRDFRASVNKARELRMYGAGLSIGAGDYHTVISTKGRVYTCGGCNDEDWEENEELHEVNRAHLGHSDSVNELVPRLVEALVDLNVLGTAAGDDHTVVWTDEGNAYSFGRGSFGRLGHGGEEIELVPKLIEGVMVRKRVVGVAAGAIHTVVWTDEGKAYSFGRGGFGRLGHGSKDDELVPRLIEGVLVGKRVVGVATGSAYTVVMTDEGKVYSFGRGKRGRLGHGGNDDEFVPRLIEGVLVGKRVVGVAAGNQHTVVWTDKGKVYSFGYGDCGQLGHGDEEDELVPRLIGGVLERKRVVGVAAGGGHTVVWTNKGKAYSFGYGENGQLGHGGKEDELVPRLIEDVLVGKMVIGVAAGDEHTVVWTDEKVNNVYSFGDGGYGKLGHGGIETELVPRLIHHISQP